MVGKGLMANDVADFLLLFELEDTKLEFAKWAYEFTCDKENYMVISERFDFPVSVIELETFIYDQESLNK